MGSRVIAALGENPQARTVALLGLTFKPNTDDMRDAPAITIAHCLADAGVALRAYDPEGMATTKPLLPPATVFCSDAYDAVTGADAVVIVTEWDAFRALDLTRLAAVVNSPTLVDLRNIYRPRANSLQSGS